jgi:hypothetical protein
MYLNELTGLCRPEELIQLFRYATELSTITGKKIDSAMLSDVPGCTWGTVTAMAQAGIHYFSAGPNYGERHFMSEWADKPFYWIGPDGKSKVLVWVPFQGYALAHIYDSLSPQLLDDLCTRLQKPEYTYEIAYIRWAGLGDNGVPDERICDFVADWNKTHQSPQFVIAGTTEAFHALEKRYGSELPEYRGDWTPYWENGAGSSAHETAMNRQNAEQLTQAQTLFAMFDPGGDPKDAFDAAWQNVLLFSEHTWGAQGSVSDPEHPQTTQQWAVKKGYAEQAADQSLALTRRALISERTGDDTHTSGTLAVINTLSWERSQLVMVPRELSLTGDRVLDETGRVAPSQRLGSGELAFLAKRVPAFATRRYRIEGGPTGLPDRTVQARGEQLDNGIIHVRVDGTTGGIAELSSRGIAQNFAGSANAEQLNSFIYLRGDAPSQIQTNGPVKISVGENGPLVASLVIDSDASGCRHLQRELRSVAGQDWVEVFNRVDKERLEVASYQTMEGKESLDFGFPFQMPEADVTLDLPLAAMQPGVGQIPASCNQWFSIGRWVNVANADLGLTWVTLDAPLVQFDDPTAGIRERHSSSFKRGPHHLYSWVMNNQWGTNYKAYQEGLTEFRYVLRPFRKSDPAEATRFATGFSQPLLVTRSALADTQSASRFTLPRLDSDNVIVTAAKPSDDGHALIVRLFGASGKNQLISLTWPANHPTKVFLSDTSEKPLSKMTDQLTVPGYGMITLRAEFE